MHQVADGTLLSHFLSETFTIFLLTSGMLNPTRQGLLILLARPPPGLPALNLCALSRAVDVSPVTRPADEHNKAAVGTEVHSC